MKKIISIMLVACIAVSCVLVSCDRADTGSDLAESVVSIDLSSDAVSSASSADFSADFVSNSEDRNGDTSGTADNHGGTVSTGTDVGSSSGGGSLCPPTTVTYTFYSYKETTAALTDTKNSGFRSIRENLSKTTSKYSSMVSKFESGKLKCYVPTLDGDVIELDHASLMACELYNMPWLWYNCVVDRERLTICISYADLSADSRLATARSYLDAQNIIAPAAPSPDNYKQSSYDAIYEKELRLSDGTVTKALISKPSDDTRMYVKIYHNGMLIRLVGDKRLLTDGFFELFDLKSADEISIDTKPAQKFPAETSAG